MIDISWYIGKFDIEVNVEARANLQELFISIEPVEKALLLDPEIINELRNIQIDINSGKLSEFLFNDDAFRLALNKCADEYVESLISF